MNRTVEVNRRSQVEEYLSEYAIRSKLESGSRKREFRFWCVLRWWNVVGIRTRTQGGLN